MTTLILPRETTRVPLRMSPETIYVAPLSLVETTVADANVSHLVTLINGETLYDSGKSDGPFGDYYELLSEIEIKFNLGDLHDENAMVDEDGYLVPVDFGC